MEDDDNLGDSLDNLSWFAYGCLCAEDDKRSSQDPRGETFGCLAVVVFVVCGVLWALTESVTFAVICGLIGLIAAWKLCYGSWAKERDDESEDTIQKVKWGEKKSARNCSRGLRK